MQLGNTSSFSKTRSAVLPFNRICICFMLQDYEFNAFSIDLSSPDSIKPSVTLSGEVEVLCIISTIHCLMCAVPVIYLCCKQMIVSSFFWCLDFTNVSVVACNYCSHVHTCTGLETACGGRQADGAQSVRREPQR